MRTIHDFEAIGNFSYEECPKYYNQEREDEEISYNY